MIHIAFYEDSLESEPYREYTGNRLEARWGEDIMLDGKELATISRRCDCNYFILRDDSERKWLSYMVVTNS
jgi:hypothetical protein